MNKNEIIIGYQRNRTDLFKIDFTEKTINLVSTVRISCFTKSISKICENNLISMDRLGNLRFYKINAEQNYLLEKGTFNIGDVCRKLIYYGENTKLISCGITGKIHEIKIFKSSDENVAVIKNFQNYLFKYLGLKYYNLEQAIMLEYNQISDIKDFICFDILQIFNEKFSSTEKTELLVKYAEQCDKGLYVSNIFEILNNFLTIFD